MSEPAPLRVLDLFSGIGGFSLGLERTGGFKTVAFCEIDPFARDVLTKHWPDVPCHDDVETRQFDEGEADVITAGFPCQDISFAGTGAGLAGARSGLYRHVIRAIRLVRPRFAILENVAALLGRGLGTVLGDMAEIGADAEWHCIPASAVGAPHRRDRIWVVADARGEQHKSSGAPLSGAFAAELVGSDANHQWQPQPKGGVAHERRWFGDVGAPLADPDSQRGRGWTADRKDAAHVGQPSGRSWLGQWLSEPNVGRVADGIPARVDRLRSLGNAVVPQIPELIGRAILASQREHRDAA